MAKTITKTSWIVSISPIIDVPDEGLSQWISLLGDLATYLVPALQSMCRQVEGVLQELLVKKLVFKQTFQQEPAHANVFLETKPAMLEDILARRESSILSRQLWKLTEDSQIASA